VGAELSETANLSRSKEFHSAAIAPPANAGKEKYMTTTTNIGARREGMKARAFAPCALACLGWLSLASAVEAQPIQQYKNGACTSSKICTIDFLTTPTGKRIEVTNVSCYLRVTGSSELHAMQFLVAQGSSIVSAFTVEPRLIGGAPGTSYVYAANHPVFAYATAGRRLQAYVELKQGAFSQFACHISGQMVPA
jgi:hypothetical protein